MVSNAQTERSPAVLKLVQEVIMVSVQTEIVYTVAEIATALKVSSETIRRRIVEGELHAIEIGGSPRRQYRVLAKDLSAWIGPEAAASIFGIGRGLDQLQKAFALLEPSEREALINEAQAWARAQMPTPKPTGRVASRELISSRFPK
jgi:excisionase family DNA binding protein